MKNKIIIIFSLILCNYLFLFANDNTFSLTKFNDLYSKDEKIRLNSYYFLKNKYNSYINNQKQIVLKSNDDLKILKALRLLSDFNEIKSDKIVELKYNNLILKHKKQYSKIKSDVILINRRKEIILKCIDIIKETRKNYYLNDRKTLAIKLLGDYRAVLAIDCLIDNIKYTPKYGEIDEKTIETIYPAVESLIKIGEPSVIPLIIKLKKGNYYLTEHIIQKIKQKEDISDVVETIKKNNKSKIKNIKTINEFIKYLKRK